LVPAQVDSDGNWTAAQGVWQCVFIPDVSDLAGDPSTADIAALQPQFDTAFTAIATAIAGVNSTRGLV
jgi:hypothetical protein